MDAVTAGLEGAVAYLDDVIVVGRTEKEHKQNLEAVLRRMSGSSLHIRLEKCRFGKPEIKYLDEIVNKGAGSRTQRKLGQSSRCQCPPF